MNLQRRLLGLALLSTLTLLAGCAGGQMSVLSALRSFEVRPDLQGVVADDAVLVQPTDQPPYLSVMVLEVLEAKGEREGSLREVRYSGPIDELRLMRLWLKTGQRLEALGSLDASDKPFLARALWRRQGLPAGWIPLAIDLLKAPTNL